MRRKIIVSIILIAVLLTGGIGISAGLVLTRPSPPRRDTDRPSLVVQTLVVNPQTVVETIVGYGTAWADRYARLSAQVSGEIVELDDWVRPGAAVESGQVLLRIDEADYRSRLEGATSRLAAQRARLAELDAEEGNINRLIAIAAKERDIAQSEFDRVEALFEGGESHPREYDEYHRALQRARSALQVHENRKTRLPSQRTQLEAGCGDRESDVALAQLNLDRCRITAPFAGRIDQVGVELGERIQVGQELLALLNPELIEVPIELPISVRHRVSSDAACRLSIDSSGEVVWSGRVQRISPSASESTRTFKLYVEVDNRQQDERLVPGSFVRAEIDGPTLEDVLIIPRGVVQQGRVYVYRTGQAHPCPVQVVRHLQDRAVVTGLQPGDRVITSNLDALYDGAAVSLEGTARATPPSDGEALTAGTETR